MSFTYADAAAVAEIPSVNADTKPASALEDCEAYLSEHQERFLSDLVEFLRIPSVSADPAHRADVFATSRWLMSRMRAAGIENVEELLAGEFPVVYGDWLHAPSAPTVLVYGHFDVQPAGDPAAWTTPPFEPSVRDGRIYARGATDDKGNMLQPILAVEALLRCRGRLPLNLKFIFEGEEEILSPDMPSFVHAHRGRLACDMVVSADGWQWSDTEADLRLGLRGICALEVTVTGPSHDLHAGSHGGAVANPVRGLAAMIASLHDEAGTIRVEGFYEHVRPLEPSMRAAIAKVPFDEVAYAKRLGVPALAGEAGYSTRERIGVRPTVEVNGMHGGYEGPGVKTIVPARAGAKLTCRLVPDQRPEEVAEKVKAHLLAVVPQGLKATVDVLPNAAHPYSIAPDHPANKAARDVLVELFGSEPYYTFSGGSIPILPLFKQELGASTVIYGFGLPDENMHGPDEFLRLSSFRKGQGAYLRLLTRLPCLADTGGAVKA